MIFRLTEKPSVAHHFLAELRHQKIQADPMRFRQNLRRIGQILAYEISKTLEYQETKIKTPLATCSTLQSPDLPILITVLRAGLPFFDGFLDVFDRSSSAFIGAFRGKPTENQTFDIEMGYVTSPNLTDKTIILIDPMIATGKSMVKTYKALLGFGQPKKCHIAGVIAAQTGLDWVQKNIPKASIWIGDVDAELNAKSYIVPGLGDAGDLAFGQKI